MSRPVPGDRPAGAERPPGAPDDAAPLELRDYLTVLRRRRWTVVVTTAVAVGAAIALSLLQTPVYAAYAEVLLRPGGPDALVDGGPAARTAADRQGEIRTEIEVMQARSVRDAVTEALGRPVDVTVEAKGETDVVRLTARSTDPAAAAEAANVYAETYVATRRAAQVADLLTAAEQVQAQLTGIDAELAALDARVDELDDRIVATDDAGQRAALERERDELEDDLGPEIESLRSRRAAYDEQLDRLSLAGELTRAGGAQIVSAAVEPGAPVAPTPRRNALAALALGLTLGVGLAFVREYLDDSVKSKDDLEAATGGTWVLSTVPAVTTWRDRTAPRLVTATASTSPAAEAYRTLRTGVQFMGLDRPMAVVQVTSPSAAEGKTTTLANLGVAFARAGLRTVVVDADLRRPRLHEFFGLSNDVGLTSVLLGDVEPWDAVVPADREPSLAVLPAGPVLPNPSELLSAARTAEILRMLREECDVVLVDSPPVLPVTDALIVGGLVDGVVLVARASSTTARDVRRAVEQLSQVGAPLVGTVLNGAGAVGPYGYGYDPGERGVERRRRRRASPVAGPVGVAGR